MTLYMDCTAKSTLGTPIGVIPENGEHIVFAGATIYSMDSCEKNSTYRDYALNHNVNFIFDDAIPYIDFYSIPRLDIFAYDSKGGLWATYGEVTDIASDAPIYYIDCNKNCFSVADNFKIFIDMLDGKIPWQKYKDKAIDGIVFYPSKESAMQTLDFIPIP